MDDEYVMVFPTSLLEGIGTFQGINYNAKKYLDIINKNYTFKLRSKVEKDNTFKQLIPYTILVYQNTVFSYRRGKLLSEDRLLGKYSIGIGGHISVQDQNLFKTTYYEGMEREVNEEIYLKSNYIEKLVAVLNDDSNDVGKVHFGLVHKFILESPNVRKKEKSINEPTFLTIENLKQNYNKYENWSQICIDEIHKFLAL